MSEDDYLFDKSGKPDPEVEELEKVLGSARYVSPQRNRAERVHGRRAKPARSRVFLYAAPLALAAAILLVLALRDRLRPEGPSLAVTSLAGAPRVDARKVDERGGRLGVGAWLETDQASRADIELQQIGHVAVGPGSRVQLVSIAKNEQRLQLERGVIEAKVLAVPRLFVVDTPSARATDLGCAYRLEVMPDGGTLLRVQTGAVELAGEGRQSHVPAGATCETRTKRGPGTPYFDDASDAFKTALRHLDFDVQQDPRTLDTVLGAAREADTLTLWQLIWRVDGEKRQRVLARVMELVPPPPGVDLASGPGAFKAYQDHLMTHW